MYYVILHVFLLCICMFSFYFRLSLFFFFFKQKTAYEMRISDWSSDVCSSDLRLFQPFEHLLTEIVIGSGARKILDIGCGAGATTLAVARGLVKLGDRKSVV